MTIEVWTEEQIRVIDPDPVYCNPTYTKFGRRPTVVKLSNGWSAWPVPAIQPLCFIVTDGNQIVPPCIPKVAD